MYSTKIWARLRFKRRLVMRVHGLQIVRMDPGFISRLPWNLDKSARDTVTLAPRTPDKSLSKTRLYPGFKCRLGTLWVGLTECTNNPVAPASFIEEDTLVWQPTTALNFFWFFIHIRRFFFDFWFLQVGPICPTYGLYLKHFPGLYNLPEWQTLNRW